MSKLTKEKVLQALVKLAAKKEGGYSSVTFQEIAGELDVTHPHVIKVIGGKSKVAPELKEYLKGRYDVGLTSEEARVFNQVSYSSINFAAPVALIKRKWTNEF